MIKNLKGLSKRFFISNRWITFSSIIAISLSTLLITSILNFSINSENNLKKETLEKFGAFQMVCSYDYDNSKVINQDFLNKIASLDGIYKISPLIMNYTDINGIDTYTLGVENDDISRSRYGYINDIEENTIIINKQLASSLKVNVGDNILVNSHENKIIEIFDDKTYSSNSINMAIMNRESLRRLLDFEGESNYIQVKTNNENDISKVSTELINLDNDLNVDVFQEDENLKDNINTMRYFIGFLGILVFIICGIFIVSNLQGYIYKYTKDFAIIKAIGGSSFQVFITVLIQTIMINIIGIFSGLILSFLIYKLFLTSFQYYIFPLVKISLIGFVIIQMVLLIPAFKTCRILPQKVMSKNENIDFKHSKLIKSIMTISTVIGILLISDSIFLNEKDSFINGIIGFLFIYVGSFLFVMMYINKILSLFIKPLKILIGIIGTVSIKMLIHQVKKSSILILAITTMIIITTLGGSLVKLITINSENYYRSEYLTDIVLTSDDKLDYKETLHILNDVNKIDGTVASTITEGGTTHIIGNNINEDVTFTLGNLEEMEKQNIIKRFEGNGKSKVIINEKYAKDYNIKVGDKLKFIQLKQERQPNVIYKEDIEKKNYQYDLEVTSIENDHLMNYNDVLIDIGNSDMLDNISGMLNKMYIDTTNKNINILLNNLKEEYPSIKWATLDNVLIETNKAIEARWKYFELALIIMDCIILFGIIISIKNNINSNRKQYALLRCMKFKQKDLSKMITIQTIVFLSLGQVLGLMLGTLGSFIVAMSDGGNKFITPDYITLILIYIFSIILTLLFIIPDICRVKKEKLIVELNQEEI
ncbi:FtsX-like permease family protein [Clostridium botulinum]|nr:FtsX-like permease family protein [Clostridium botulinum]NFR15922.1 FtsX-like permease family protein [Clostridium botulinum]NFR45133.1 FtsX-like permease family protein [Clostridium botulinum]NFS52029.1 FtsX-like permease family protein [Clostridium botulinum]